VIQVVQRAKREGKRKGEKKGKKCHIRVDPVM
jgi:hypothetical protein